jgi:hypothetical protein
MTHQKFPATAWTRGFKIVCTLRSSVEAPLSDIVAGGTVEVPGTPVVQKQCDEGVLRRAQRDKGRLRRIQGDLETTLAPGNTMTHQKCQPRDEEPDE